jgi:hypothetical protein
VAAVAVVVTPFAILARGRMYDMVIRDQLLRRQEGSPRGGRFSSILGIQTFLAGHRSALQAAIIVGVVLLGTAAVVCLTDRAARVIVAMLAVDLAVLLASPTYFTHYAALTAAPAALVVGVALGKLASARRDRPARRAVVATSLAAFMVSGIWIASTPEDRAFPGPSLAAAAPEGCVTSDDPQALIQMNRLSADFRSRCRVAIDVTGITYDSLHRLNAAGRDVHRRDNVAFQQYLYRYLLSGQSFVVARRTGDEMPDSVARALARRPALARSHGLVLRKGLGVAARGAVVPDSEPASVGGGT